MAKTLQSVIGTSMGFPFFGVYNRQEFLATADWTVPPGARFVYVTAVGTGGGGGGSTATTAGGGGGGGGGRGWRIPFYADSSLISAVTVTIGAVGTAGAAGGGSGGNGGNVTFGSYMTFQGGRLGVGTSGTEVGGVGGSVTLASGLYKHFATNSPAGGAAGVTGNPGTKPTEVSWSSLVVQTPLLGWSWASSTINFPVNALFFRGMVSGGPGGGGCGLASTNAGGAGGDGDTTSLAWTDILHANMNITSVTGGAAGGEASGGGAGLNGDGGAANINAGGSTPTAYGAGGGGANSNSAGGAGDPGWLVVEWWV